MADEQNLDNQPPENPEAENSVAEDLAARVQSLEEQLAAAQDQSLRVAAEVQNIRRRAEQDVEKAHKFALEKFAGGLGLTRPDDETSKAVREGLELTHKLLLDTLARHQLVAVDPVGEPFNPEHHQAMAMEESMHAEPGSVIKVFQKGYLLNGRLLRPAMVVVSKAPADAPPSIDEKA